MLTVGNSGAGGRSSYEMLCSPFVKLRRAAILAFSATSVALGGRQKHTSLAICVDGMPMCYPKSTELPLLETLFRVAAASTSLPRTKRRCSLNHHGSHSPITQGRNSSHGQWSHTRRHMPDSARGQGQRCRSHEVAVATANVSSSKKSHHDRAMATGNGSRAVSSGAALFPGGFADKHSISLPSSRCYYSRVTRARCSRAIRKFMVFIPIRCDHI